LPRADEVNIKSMEKVGIHLVADAWNAPGELLDDCDRVRNALEAATQAGGATLLNLYVHQFSPQGVTATATLAESHITVHTWPEYGYFAADLFFCGSGDPHRALATLQSALGAQEIRATELERGFPVDRALDAALAV